MVEAVQCAVRLQEEISERELSQDASRRIAYRMAVNLGDVIFDEGDVFGDGVNVAARLESIAPAGGVVVSGAAYDLLKNQVRVNYQPLGKKKLKNIAAPVRVYSVIPTNSSNQGNKNVSARLWSPRLGMIAVATLGVLVSVLWGVSSFFPRADLDQRLARMALDTQQRLKAEEYLVDYEPGVFGVNTRIALANFQSDNDITQTGVLCTDTANALGVTIRIRGSDWQNVLDSKRQAGFRSPEVFSHLSNDQRLINAATVYESMEFAFGYFGDHLYIAVVPRNSTRSMDAVRLAEQTNGYLASISTKEENEFIFRLLNDDPKFWVLSTDRIAWVGPGIGLIQQAGVVEPADGWKWWSEEAVVYTNWAAGQPNDYGGVNERTATYYSYIRGSSTDENLVLSPTWNDERDWFYSFVVEIE